MSNCYLTVRGVFWRGSADCLIVTQQSSLIDIKSPRDSYGRFFVFVFVVCFVLFVCLLLFFNLLKRQYGLCGGGGFFVAYEDFIKKEFRSFPACAFFF